MDTAKSLNYDLNSIFKVLMDTIFIFGPNFAFISQIIKFRNSKSSEGFSKIVCLLILLANILRIFFWYGKRFDLSLLYQSLVSILMQFFLIYECLKVSKEMHLQKKFISSSLNDLTSNQIDEDQILNDEEKQIEINSNEFEFIEENQIIINNDNDDSHLNSKKLNQNNNLEVIDNIDQEFKKCIDDYIKPNNNRCFSFLNYFINENNIEDILNPKMFWEWSYIIDYVFFCMFFSIIVIVIYSIFGYNNYFIEILGYFSLIIESMIGIPQIIENYKNKSTKSLSIQMICIWLTGDTLKTLYFLKFNSPLQFIICGFLQILIDCSIISQISYYNKSD